MTPRLPVRRGAAARVPGVAWRGACLMLLAALVPVPTAGESAAAPAADPPVAALNAPAAIAPVSEPLRPNAGYPAALNARIAAFDQQIGTLPQRASELASETRKLTESIAALKANSEAAAKDSSIALGKASALNSKTAALNARIAAHNAAPHVFQLPAQAAAGAAYDAEKAQLDAEAAQLQAERAAIEPELSKASARQSQLADEAVKLGAQARALGTKATAIQNESQQLVSQRRQILQDAATANQGLIGTPPAPTPMARGADAPRPPAARGTGAPSAGSDARTPAGKNAAIDAHAKTNGIKVDKRPGTAYLAPDAVNRLDASDLARLTPVATYDALVPKPNGHYKALQVQDTDSETEPGQEAFNTALAKGGQATTANGGKKIIDEVETLYTCEPNSFTAGTPVLLADGRTLPIEQINPGTQVRATDTTTWNTAPHAVTAAIQHTGPHTMVDITTGNDATLHATDRHPFWNAGTGRFTDAIDLKPGDDLRNLDGTTARITSTRTYPQDLTAYNLTIDGVHTYYVLAGSTPVLVHNANCSSNAKIIGDNMTAAGITRPADTAAHHIVASTSPKAALARAQLAKFGIDINDAENGVFLPRGSASANPTGASVHSRIHTNDYFNYVNDMMAGARNANEARDVLSHIRGQLDGGYWP
ncbi:Skp family chaperone for outer membrane proteins [Kitasatospora sp. MAA19]|uniref:AHH domain-containing protein n=1 Tax=unclassified Kitasatospora TaxID=2633591 RepID=UPI0024750B31|nr:AHH domain-containing protein [Kitasatospora sp. MAA19]MDH6709183.1 Skp family chaperone for outer membrane proteins [Kitasatospora sp. MAA19]